MNKDSCTTKLQEMYNKIETDDEGDISMKKVVEHINAVEAGRGGNMWVSWVGNVSSLSCVLWCILG